MFTAMYKTIYVNCQSHKYSKPGLVFSVPADAPVGNQKNSVWSAPSHYLNQCWNVVNKPPKNKLQWKSIQNTKFSFMKMHLKTSSAKRRPFCPGGDVLKFEGKTKGSTCILDIRVMHFLKRYRHIKAITNKLHSKARMGHSTNADMELMNTMET